MKVQTPDHMARLLGNRTSPCISIYMPTQRAKPPAAENPRRLKNLIRKAEEELGRQYPHGDARVLTDKLRELLNDAAFWEHPADAVAAFVSPEVFEAIKLQQPVREMVEVADSFHLKPLIRAQQFGGRFQVLALAAHNVAVYEGSHDDLEEITSRNVPRNIFDALGLTRPTAESGGDEARIGAISGAEDRERFLRVIDRAVLENHSRPSGLPLILCAAEGQFSAFQRLSRNDSLLEAGIRRDPQGLSIDRLHEEAWGVIEPHYREQIERIMDEYGRARATQQGSEDLVQVAQAATSSRVGTLLVDADKRVGGRIDPKTGRIEFGDQSFEDVIDEIAEKVIKTGGQVLVMPHNQMPSDTGVAAIYRY